MDQITICKVKGVACSDKPAENYHLTLQFLSAARSILASFNFAAVVHYQPLS